MKFVLMVCGLSLAAAGWAKGEGKPADGADAARVQRLERQVQELRKAAGFSTLRGAGVVVRLRDRAGVPRDKIGFGTGLVHDHDLLEVVNELRGAQAQGIAINGVRLTSQTAIRAIGPRIHVGGQAVSHPFKVEAVGDPAVLHRALSLKGGLLDGFRRTQGPDARLARVARLRLLAAGNSPSHPPSRVPSQ